jgi:hypothetical protein
VALRGLPFPDGDRIVFVSTSRGADAPTPVTDVRRLREALRPGDRRRRGASRSGSRCSIAWQRTGRSPASRSLAARPARPVLLAAMAAPALRAPRTDPAEALGAD